MNLIHRISKALCLTLIIAWSAVEAHGVRITVLADVHVTPGNENDKKLREAVA